MVDIPGGYYSTPYQASQSNTEYKLQGDIIAAGTAITVTGSQVIINLNGHTITYNDTSPGEGINTGKWNLHHISVKNGSIIQGKAMSEGNIHGFGINPVSTYNTKLSKNISAEYFHVANLFVRIGGKDIGGIVVSSDNALIEENTVEDTYQFGTLKNRHQGINAITASTGAASHGAVIRNNTIVNCRHRGITTGSNAAVYGNHVTTRTIATNGYGIFGYAAKNVKAYGNTVISRGEHPIGIGFVSNGTDDIEIYDNYLDSMTTALGSEYGSLKRPNPDATIDGNYAVGFRTTWGGKNINFHHNEIHVSTDSDCAGSYSPTGEKVRLNARGRGLMVGVGKDEEARFSHNSIVVLDKDGTGTAYGISCVGNVSDRLYFFGNRVTANVTNVGLGDSYSFCRGFPLFEGNTFIRADNFLSYRTISNHESGYFDAQARFVDNTFPEGDPFQAMRLNPSGRGVVDVYFGSKKNGKYKYTFRLHDKNNTSDTIVNEKFDKPLHKNFWIPNKTDKN